MVVKESKRKWMNPVYTEESHSSFLRNTMTSGCQAEWSTHLIPALGRQNLPDPSLAEEGAGTGCYDVDSRFLRSLDLQTLLGSWACLDKQ